MTASDVDLFFACDVGEPMVVTVDYHDAGPRSWELHYFLSATSASSALQGYTIIALSMMLGRPAAPRKRKRTGDRLLSPL